MLKSSVKTRSAWNQLIFARSFEPAKGFKSGAQIILEYALEVLR